METIRDAIMQCIEHEILELQGKNVNPTILEKAGQRQNLKELVFKGARGYLRYITDTIDRYCCRFYVG